MSKQQPRFSRRFLTVLIIITSLAILLLSKMQPSQKDESMESLVAPSSKSKDAP